MMPNAARRWRRARALLVAGALVACSPERAPELPGYSGVVEYEERILAFELAGRLVERPVERGAHLEQGQPIARLDATLEELSVEVRAQELVSAEARASLVGARAKSEDLAAQSARVRAARAAEARVEQTLKQERVLAERGVTAPAALEDLERQLDQARAERASLESQYASLAKGAKTEERDSAAAQAETARAALAAARERVGRYELRAPSPGEVIAVHAEPGEMVSPGSPVVTLADVSHPLVEVFVPQGKMSGVRLGTKAKVRVDGQAQPLDAVVEYVSSRLEFTPRFLFSVEERPRLVLRVRLRIDDPERKLVAGLPAFASFL
jgi:HlyD family secretion protein